MMKTPPKYPYHERVREFVKVRDRPGIFAFYGAGKTWQTLQWFHDHGCGLPALVLCPKSVITHWDAQICLHTNLRPVCLLGGAEKRIEQLRQDGDVYVLNYDAYRSPQLRTELERLASIGKWGTIVVDECQALKNARTQRFKWLYRVFRNIHYRAILTGRPVTEYPEELFAQMLFLDDGNTFGRSFWKFRNTYFFAGPPWAPYDWELKPSAVKTIAAKLSASCIRVTKEEISGELPPQVYVPVYFEFSPTLRQKYRLLKKEFWIDLQRQSQSQSQSQSQPILSPFHWETMWAVARTQKMHQMCCGFMYDPDGTPLYIHSMKLDWLVENVPELLRIGPTLIWTHYKYELERISSTLRAAGVVCAIFQGGGDMSGVETFKEGGTDVLILSEDAGHQGLDLWRANNAVFYSTSFKAGQRKNAEDRCHRLGSEIHEQVTYYDLIVRQSLDEVVLKVIQEKVSIGDAILKHLGED